MKNQKYEQPKLELVAIATTDILLTSNTGETETVGALDPEFDTALASATWSEVWGE